MTPSAHDFLQALGRPHTDPMVADLLDRVGLAHQSIKLKKGDFDNAFDAPDHGVDLVFSDPQAYTSASSVPEGALVFSCVFFFSQGREKHRQYPLPLPAELAFGLSRADVHKRLGAPEFTSPILPVDRWNWNGLKLAVTFVEALSSVARISCSLPKAS